MWGKEVNALWCANIVVMISTSQARIKEPVVWGALGELRPRHPHNLTNLQSMVGLKVFKLRHWMPPSSCRRATLEAHTELFAEEFQGTAGACLQRPDPRLAHSDSLGRHWLFTQDSAGPAQWKWALKTTAWPLERGNWPNGWLLSWNGPLNWSSTPPPLKGGWG